MDKPKVSYTTKSGYTVTLDDPKKLVVKQGRKCIDGGWIKRNGKDTRLMVPYDDNAELAQQITDWKAAWIEYQAEVAAEFNSRIPGLVELEAALAAAQEEERAYRLAMESESETFPTDARRQAANELATQHPQAAMYIKAQAYTYASNDRKYSAGKQAMALIASGGDLSDAQDILDNWSPGFTD